MTFVVVVVVAFFLWLGCPLWLCSLTPCWAPCRLLLLLLLLLALVDVFLLFLFFCVGDADVRRRGQDEDDSAPEGGTHRQDIARRGSLQRRRFVEIPLLGPRQRIPTGAAADGRRRRRQITVALSVVGLVHLVVVVDVVVVQRVVAVGRRAAGRLLLLLSVVVVVVGAGALRRHQHDQSESTVTSHESISKAGRRVGDVVIDHLTIGRQTPP